MNETQYNGLMVALKLPESVTAALASYPLTTEDRDDLHITLVYLGDAKDYDVGAITSLVSRWAQDIAPMEGRLAGTGVFNNDNNVLWASVNIPKLEDAHVSLRGMLEASGVEIKHVNGFTPHATLSYSEEEFKEIPALPEKAMEKFSVDSVWIVTGPDWTEVPLAKTSAKSVTHPDAVPQENLTSLTRGRGPRRGNLEDLLDFWRPIMKKPGGFRRCIVILADHPELYPLPPLCAWLHHETTGKWPNEGNHHGNRRRRRRKITRRVRKRSRRHSKEAASAEGVVISGLRLAKRESRECGGILTQPINGRSNAVEFKAALYHKSLALGYVEGEVKVGFVTSNTVTGRAAQSVGSVVAPGDLGDIRHPVRSTIFEALTPGGAGGRLRKPRVGLPGRTGRAARNAFRCPPGFERGGTFTNSSFSTCGRQILAIPKSGPGSLTPKAEARLRKIAEDASMIRSIGDLRDNRNPFDIIRAAQIPEAPKEVGTSARQASVDLVINAINKTPNEDFGARAVRRDGVILQPSVSLGALNGLGEFDDLNDGVLIVSDNFRKPDVQIGRDEVPSMVTGLRAIVFHIPQFGSLSIRRVGGDMKPAERKSFNRTFAAALKAVGTDNPDPTAAIRKFIQDSNDRYSLDQNLGPDRKLIVIERDGRKITVPQWVFSAYLSRTAPRRNKDTPPWKKIEGESKAAASKAMQMFAIKSQNPTIKDVSESYAPYFGIVESRVSDFVALGNGDVKASRLRRAARRAIVPGGGRSGGRRGRIADLVPGRRGRGGGSGAIWDAATERFRCPPGTSNGGKFSDQFGRNCGARLDNHTISKLSAKAKILGLLRVGENATDKAPHAVPNRNIEKEKWSKFDDALKQSGQNFDQALENVDRAVKELRDAIDVAEQGKARPGRIGPSLRQRSERVALNDRQKKVLQGEELLAAMQDLADIIGDDPYQDAPKEAAVQAFQRLQKAATVEAGRLGVNPARDRDQLKRRSDMRHQLNRALDTIDAPTKAAKDPKRGVVARVANRLADIADPNADAPPVGAGFRARANRFIDKLAGGGLRRRDAVPIPELENLNDTDRGKVHRAMISVWEGMDDGWKARLGTEDFDLPEVQAYIRKVRQENPDDPNLSLLERRRDDWVELGQLIDNEDTNIDYADIAGRLSPANREDVIRTADLKFSEARERQRQARLERERSAAEAAKLKAEADRQKERDRRAARRNRRNKKEKLPPLPALVEQRPVSEHRLGPVNERGFAYVGRVEVGNSGMDTVQDAVDFVAAGGELAEVPDDFLGAVVVQNPDRFELIGEGGGVNGMSRYKDKVTGRLLGLKFVSSNDDRGTAGGVGYGYDEGYAEVIGAHMGERLGFVQGQVRFDGGPASDLYAVDEHGRRIFTGPDSSPTPVVLVELGQDIIPENVHASGLEAPNNLRDVHPDDALRLSMLDFILGGTDRHGKNYFQFMVQGEQKLRLYPIDNGLSINGRPWELRDRTSGRQLIEFPVEDQLAAYVDMDLGGKRNLIVQYLRRGEYGDKPEVLATIARMQEQLRVASERLSFGDAVAEIMGNTPHTPGTGWDEQMRHVLDRHDWLVDASPEEIYNALYGVPSPPGAF